MSCSRRCSLLAVLVLIAACGKKDPPPADAPPAEVPAAAPPASAPAATRVTLASVTLGKAVDADKKVTTVAEVFDRGDTVHASVATDGAGSATLGARWARERNGQHQTVAEDTVALSPTGPAVTDFRFATPDGTPTGDYQVEILLDGQVQATRTFKVQQPVVARQRPPAKAKPVAPASRGNLPDASKEQLHAASLVYYGKYNCENGRTMTITRSRGGEGYVDLRTGRRKATLMPVLSTTGAVRLEEVHQGALLVVQIPAKSILFNQKAGKRLIDGCRHATQRQVATAEAGRQNSLGMNQPGQVQTGGAPTR